jgi:hypothetical protein
LDTQPYEIAFAAHFENNHNSEAMYERVFPTSPDCDVVWAWRISK